MNENKHSLPHVSRKHGHHLDVYPNREGCDESRGERYKCHEIIDGPRVDPRSIDGLRQRLKSQKGY